MMAVTFQARVDAQCFSCSVGILMMTTFAEYLESSFPDEGKRSTSGLVHAELGEKIKRYLRNINKNFRFMVKIIFKLLDLPSWQI